MDYYTSMTPEERLAIYKAEQFEIYGEAALSDPRWNSDFWKQPRQ